MPQIRFTDGMTIETSGEYRVIRKSDGLYVVGRGFLCAVESEEEGAQLIRTLTERK